MPLSDELSAFYVVARDHETLQSQKRYADLAAAQAEAERLCAKENKPFFILKAIAACFPAAIPVTWRALQPSGE